MSKCFFSHLVQTGFNISDRAGDEILVWYSNTCSCWSRIWSGFWSHEGFFVFCFFLRFLNSYLVLKNGVHIQISPHALQETSHTYRGFTDKRVGAEISKRRNRAREGESAGGGLKACSEILSEWAFILKEKEDQQDFHNKLVVRETESCRSAAD